MPAAGWKSCPLDGSDDLHDRGRQDQRQQDQDPNPERLSDEPKQQPQRKTDEDSNGDWPDREPNSHHDAASSSDVSPARPRVFPIKTHKEQARLVPPAIRSLDRFAPIPPTIDPVDQSESLPVSAFPNRALVGRRRRLARRLEAHLVLQAEAEGDPNQRDQGQDDDVGEGGREDRPKKVGGDEDLEAQHEAPPQSVAHFVGRWRRSQPKKRPG